MSTKKLEPILEKRLGSFTFGMFLRVARTRKQMSQTKFAKKLGIARGTLCDIEKGRQLVSPKLAKKIAKIAGLSPEVAIETCLQDHLKKAKINLKVQISA